MFILKKDDLSVNFNMDMIIYLDDKIVDGQEIITIKLSGMKIEYELAQEQSNNNLITINWNKIELGDAKIVPGPKNPMNIQASQNVLFSV